MRCIPLKTKSEKELFGLMKKISPKNADCLEIWLDHLQKSDVSKIIKKAPLPIILVNRTHPSFEIFQEGIKNSVAYIDLDMNSGSKLIKKIIKEKKKTKVILSYHNDQKTPSTQKIEKITKKMFQTGADIVKIATKICKIEDNFRLFLLLEKYHHKKMIIHGMGEKGKIGRIYAALLGSSISYVALNEDRKSAKGQWTVDEWNSMMI